MGDRKMKQDEYKVEFHDIKNMQDNFKMFSLPPSHENSKWKEVIQDERILKEVEDIIKNYSGAIYKELRVKNKKVVIIIDGWRKYYSIDEKKEYDLFHFTIEYSENGKVNIYEPKYYDQNNNLLSLLDDINMVLK